MIESRPEPLSGGALVRSQGLSFGGSLVLAAIGGLAQTLSWPWPGLWPLSFICLAALIVAVEGRGGRQAFFLGWVYGLSLSLSALPWLAEVLATYGGLGPALGWLLLLALAAYLALYKAIFAWLITWRPRSLALWVLLGSTAACGLDWLQNWLFTGFNWTPLAGPLVLSSSLAQTASLLGFYGLGLPVAAINFCLALAWLGRSRGLGAWLKPLAVALGLLTAAFLWGQREFVRWEALAETAERQPAAVIQPSTDQVHKWDENYRRQLLARLTELHQQAAAGRPWLILWPETALPFIIDQDWRESQWLRRLSAETDSLILAGLTGLSGLWPEEKLHNRLLLLWQGEALGRYDKRHLVPFGEYLPFSELPFFRWAFMQGLIGAAGVYSPGLAAEPLAAPLRPADPASETLRLGVMICFESTFPYIGRQRALEGAELLLVPTNDGWFGRSRAPEQHLWQASMRALETRRPLLRAANTGISALIYPSGRVQVLAGLYDRGSFAVQLPLWRASELGQSFFTLRGFAMAPAAAIITVYWMLVVFLSRRFASRRARRAGQKFIPAHHQRGR